MSDLHYFRPDWIQPDDRTLTADLAVYGATSAGLVAAITAVRRGKTVIVLNPGRHIGGLTTGGLGFTDYGKQHVIGGYAREFYRRVGAVFGKTEEWYFPPSAAQLAFDSWLAEYSIAVHNNQYIDRVHIASGVIQEIQMLGGLRVRARVFLDCSYEGDLLARAGTSHTVGREANSQYGETLNGIQVLDKHQFVPAFVSPFVRPGDPSSGLLPYIESANLAPLQGQADHRVQAYNFRVCMTNDTSLKVPWPKPAHFNPAWYVLASRWFSADKNHFNEQIHDRNPLVPAKFDVLPNPTSGGGRKTDTNNHGPVSSDFIGANHDWPTASYQRREQLFQLHVSYQQGLYWHMANSPDIPDRYRAAYQHWGLARDEHTHSRHWPPQLYVREARRLLSPYVITELDCMHKVRCPDPVAMGSYGLDSHNCTRFVGQDGFVHNEGDVQVQPAGPYGISYRCLTPHPTECTNLLVPVCIGASHIAYGSVRMEPVFMALGQASVQAACLAIDAHTTVQSVPYTALSELLGQTGQVMTL